MIAATLHTWKADTVTLERALAAFDMVTNGGVALLSSADAYRVGLMRDGKPVGEDGQPLSLEHVYEARLLHEHAELRWRMKAESREREGRAVLLSERSGLVRSEAAPGVIAWESRDLVAIDRWPVAYLLAGGKYRGTGMGWATSTGLSVAAITVPANVPEGVENVLHFTGFEYVKVEQENGNSFVAAERLTGIALGNPEEPK